MSKQQRSRYERAPPEGDKSETPVSGTSEIATLESWVDMLIRSRRGRVPEARGKEYDGCWNCINWYLEQTQGDARHRERLKCTLYLGLLIPVSRGRRGPLSDLAAAFEEWLTTFGDRKVQIREVVIEVLPNFLLMRFTRLVVKFRPEKTFEVSGDEDRDDERI